MQECLHPPPHATSLGRHLRRNRPCRSACTLPRMQTASEGICVGIRGKLKQATGVGKVYNLKKVEDFEGKYIQAVAGAAVGGGASASSLRNEKGVVINLTAVG